MKTRQANKILKRAFLVKQHALYSPYRNSTLKKMLKVVKRRKSDFFKSSAIAFVETSLKFKNYGA